MQALVHHGIHRRYHLRDGHQPFADGAQHLGFALAAVAKQMLHEALRIGDRLAVGGVIDGVVAGQEFLQTGHVIGHVAVRRSDDGGAPAHDMIAGEEGLLLGQRKAEMVAGMAGGVNGSERPAGTRHALAIDEHTIGGIGRIEAGIGARAIVAQHQGRAADNLRTGRGLQRRRGGRVIHVGVGDDDVRYRLANQPVDERAEMRRLSRAGIDHRHGAAGLANHEGAGAGEGEGRRVACQQPAHQRGTRHEQAIDGAVGVAGEIHASHVAAPPRDVKGG